MTAYAFGTGTLVARRTDLSNSTPFLFGTLHDISLSFDQKLESLLGQNKVAVALGDGELKISGKAKFARLQMTLFSNLMFGNTTVTNGGLQMVSNGEVMTVPASTPYTAVISNAAQTPLADYGVFYQSTGIQLMLVASGPTVGQYSFNSSTGTYTFAAADANAPLYVYYTYSSTAGNKVVYSNPLMGSSPVFEIYFKTSTPNFGVAKDMTIKLNACKSSKLSLSFSNQKFTIPEFDFQAMADAAGNVFTLTTAE